MSLGGVEGRLLTLWSIFLIRQLTVQVLRIGKGGEGATDENSLTGLLAWLPIQVRLRMVSPLSGLSGQAYYIMGLGTTFSSRWSLELACLSWQGSKTGTVPEQPIIWELVSSQSVH